MEKMVNEIEVCTVQEMRDALADFPADMPLTDVFESPCMLRLWEDTETGGKYLTVE